MRLVQVDVEAIKYSETTLFNEISCLPTKANSLMSVPPLKDPICPL